MDKDSIIGKFYLPISSQKLIHRDAVTSRERQVIHNGVKSSLMIRVSTLIERL